MAKQLGIVRVHLGDAMGVPQAKKDRKLYCEVEMLGMDVRICSEPQEWSERMSLTPDTYIFNMTREEDGLEIEFKEKHRLRKDKSVVKKTVPVNINTDEPSRKFTLEFDEGGKIEVDIQTEAVSKMDKKDWEAVLKPGAHIMLDIDPWHAKLEIQGDLPESAVIYATQDLDHRLERLEKKGGHLGWVINHGGDKIYGTFGPKANAKRVNKCNAAIYKIMNRFAALGYRPEPGLQNYLRLHVTENNDHKSYWWVEEDPDTIRMHKIAPATPFGEPTTPQYMCINPTVHVMNPKYRIDLVGNIPGRVVETICSGKLPFKAEQSADAKSGELINIMLEVTDINLISMGSSKRQRRDNAWDSAILYVMDMLESLGIRHVTVQGSRHIFQVGGHQSWQQPPMGPRFAVLDFAKIDHWITESVFCEMQGGVGMADLQAVEAALRQAPKALMVKDEFVSCYMFEIPEWKTLTWTTKGEEKQVTKVQSAACKVIDALASSGLRVHSNLDTDKLIMMRDPNCQRAPYTLITDVTVGGGIEIAIQGAINSELAQAIGQSCGTTARQQVADGNHIAWSMPVPGAKKYTFSCRAGNTTENQVQLMLVRVWDQLAANGWKVAMRMPLAPNLMAKHTMDNSFRCRAKQSEVFYEHHRNPEWVSLMLQRPLDPATCRGFYILIDISDAATFSAKKYFAEITAPGLNEQALAQALQKQGVKEPLERVSVSGVDLAWRLSITSPTSGFGISSNRAKETFIQNWMLKLSDVVVCQLGAYYVLPLFNDCHLFFKPC